MGIFNDTLEVGFVSKDGLYSKTTRTIIEDIDLTGFGLKIKNIDTIWVKNFKEPEYPGEELGWSTVVPDGSVQMVIVTYVGRKNAVKRARNYCEEYFNHVTILNGIIRW